MSAGKGQWGSRSVDVFEKVEQVGEGTYGAHALGKTASAALRVPCRFGRAAAALTACWAV